MREVASRRGASVITCPSTPCGTVDIKAFQSLLYSLDSRIIIVCMTHVPTNCGAVNDLEGIGKAIEKCNIERREQRSGKEIMFIVDACQSVGQRCVSVDELRCHVLTATGRKYLRGPRGTGFLYVRKRLADRLVPSHVDHFGAPVVKEIVPGNLCASSPEDVAYKYRDGARRFEFWERSVSNVLGLGAAVDHFMEVGVHFVERRCKELALTLSRNLKDHLGDRVSIYYDPENGIGDYCGIMTFSVGDFDAHEVKAYLLQEGGFTTSVVPETSTPLYSSRTGCGDLVRVSLSYFNTDDEIKAMCFLLKEMVES
uniref:Aminotransferase class V domain-containing protein n=2 Tax=Corethron hystrix TaxID=216773 RepID=A0A7S1BV24_9STRA|mmetsp:Transcript_40173/g.94443  ORF Transcript_40173/g.94443 Transcript_40173/m.94443 type:complete len:312 (+) Transcript_40173:747-1682(+)